MKWRNAVPSAQALPDPDDEGPEDGLVEAAGAGAAGDAAAGAAAGADSLAGAPEDPSTRFFFLSPSFLKSVSYQPPPASRNCGALSMRPTCGSPQFGHTLGSASDIFCRRSKR